MDEDENNWKNSIFQRKFSSFSKSPQNPGVGSEEPVAGPVRACIVNPWTLEIFSESATSGKHRIEETN